MASNGSECCLPGIPKGAFGRPFCCVFAEQLTQFFLKTFVCVQTNFEEWRY